MATNLAVPKPGSRVGLRDTFFPRRISSSEQPGGVFDLSRPGGLGRACRPASHTGGYNLFMTGENDFRKQADAALESLKKSLMEAEESAELEVEDQSGALHVSFEDRSKFVISPNAAVRQIWISALATSFKLDWSDAEQDFVLSKTGERLKILVARLINQQLGEGLVTLG
jgi:iron donor protein CyaY